MPAREQACPADCPQSEILRQIKGSLDRLVLAFEGDGTEDRPGYKIRMDRLEQSAKLRGVWLAVIGTGLVGVIGERALSIVSAAYATAQRAHQAGTP